jgi:hypothetical protein
LAKLLVEPCLVVGDARGGGAFGDLAVVGDRRVALALAPERERLVLDDRLQPGDEVVLAGATAGFWESAPLTGRGESASFLVERVRGGTFVTAISTPAPDCGRLFGLYGEPSVSSPRVRVGRGGRFRARRRSATDGIVAIAGRFRGRRPRLALLRATWRSGPCRANWTFRLRPVRRIPVREGRWSGSHTDGGTIGFEVVNAGREAYDFRFAWSPLFRCSDGSSYRYPVYRRESELAWIGGHGGFELRDTADDWLFTISGRLDGTAGAGSFQIIESHPDARGACDTGIVGFSVGRQHGGSSQLVVSGMHQPRAWYRISA